MAGELTYNLLKQNIVDYVERSGSSVDDPTFTRQLPFLINMAEKTIAQDLKIQGFQTAVTFSMVVGNAVYPKPNRWRETIGLQINAGISPESRRLLFPRSYEYLSVYWPNRTSTAMPKYYADYNFDNFLVAPTPNFAYSAELVYYQMPAQLDDANQTNWVTDVVPNLLVQAVLREAADFLKNTEMSAVAGARYKEIVASLTVEDIRKIKDRASERKSA